MFGELGNENDFDDPSAEAVAARNAVTRGDGARRDAERRRARAARRAGGERRRPRADRGAWRARCADPRRRVGGRPTQPGGDRRLVSRDGRSTYLLATFRERRRGDGAGPDRAAARAASRTSRSAAARSPAPQVSDQVSADIARAELIAFPILFLLTLLVFRSAVSALLPLAVGVSTILLSFLAIRAVNQINPMSIFSLNLINGLGLGLAIDYSLFMVSRFREELAAGHDREAALAATLRPPAGSSPSRRSPSPPRWRR